MCGVQYNPCIDETCVPHFDGDAQLRMKRYEDIGNFWSKQRAGNTESDVEQREEQQTLKAARR